LFIVKGLLNSFRLFRFYPQLIHNVTQGVDLSQISPGEGGKTAIDFWSLAVNNPWKTQFLQVNDANNSLLGLRLFGGDPSSAWGDAWLLTSPVLAAVKQFDGPQSPGEGEISQKKIAGR
jgi:hypothetical protein